MTIIIWYQLNVLVRRVLYTSKAKKREEKLVALLRSGFQNGSRWTVENGVFEGSLFFNCFIAGHSQMYWVAIHQLFVYFLYTGAKKCLSSVYSEKLHHCHHHHHSKIWPKFHSTQLINPMITWFPLLLPPPFFLCLVSHIIQTFCIYVLRSPYRSSIPRSIVLQTQKHKRTRDEIFILLVILLLPPDISVQSWWPLVV